MHTGQPEASDLIYPTKSNRLYFSNSLPPNRTAWIERSAGRLLVHVSAMSASINVRSRDARIGQGRSQPPRPLRKYPQLPSVCCEAPESGAQHTCASQDQARWLPDGEIRMSRRFDARAHPSWLRHSSPRAASSPSCGRSAHREDVVAEASPTHSALQELSPHPGHGIVDSSRGLISSVADTGSAHRIIKEDLENR